MKPATSPGSDCARIAGKTAKVSHPDRPYWPADGLTKQDLIDYYRTVAPVLLHHLRDRPMSLYRTPGGITAAGFFQKDAGPGTPAWVKTVPVRSDSDRRTLRYVLCQDEATLVYLANLGCIELNPWNSRVPTLDAPDYMVMDLDPQGVPFTTVVETAQQVRRVLEAVKAECYCKTSGKRGLHVFVPLTAGYDHDQARQFAELVARLVHQQLPETTSLARSPARRRRQVYLDYLQNGHGKTLASAYSVRPWPGAPVSAPLRWSEVSRRLDPARFTMQSMPRRLDKLGDLWAVVRSATVDIARCLAQIQQAPRL